MTFGEGEPDRVRDPLAERAGGGLDAGGVADFGMSGCLALPLPEVLDVVERQTVAAQVECRVEEHRRVADTEYNAITIGPVRIGRIVLEMRVIERIREWRERHRCAGVSGLSRLYRIHGKGADGVDRECMEFGVGQGHGTILGQGARGRSGVRSIES